MNNYVVSQKGVLNTLRILQETLDKNPLNGFANSEWKYWKSYHEEHYGPLPKDILSFNGLTKTETLSSNKGETSIRYLNRNSSTEPMEPQKKSYQSTTEWGLEEALGLTG